MPKLVITTSFVSCNTSTTGDTCVTNCCSRQSGAPSGDLDACISASACGSNVTQSATYDTCSQDDFQNTCAQNCCGTYERNDGDASTTMKICESGTYCDGLYAPGILAKLTPAQMSEFKATVGGGVSNNTAIAVGVGLGLLAIIAMIIGLLIWKLKTAKRDVEEEAEEADKFKDEGVTKNPVLVSKPNASGIHQTPTFL